MNPQEELRTHLRPASMVGGALVASLVLYLGLVEALRTLLKPFKGFAVVSEAQPLRLAAFGAAAVVTLLILILRHRLPDRDAKEDASTALDRLQRASLIVLVLGEIPAILGLGLFLAFGNATDFYALLFASLVLTFIDYPRRAAWEEWLKG